jgi:hypothetical protein
MARVKKEVIAKDGSKTEEEVEVPDTAPETTKVATVTTGDPIPMVTNVTLSIPVNIDVLPGPEVKMVTSPTVAEKAESIDLGDKVEIVGIRGFEGTVGKVLEIRTDGYIVIKASNGTFAAPKAKVQKV